jgi:hypothetical protein
MERLAACLLVFGLVTTWFSFMLFSGPKTLLSSLLDLGDVPLYALLFTGFFGMIAGYSLLKDKQKGEKAVEKVERNGDPSVANSAESRSNQSDLVEDVEVSEKVQPVQRTRIHLDIIKQLQLEYGNNRFKTRDAIRVAQDRLNADGSSTRFALNWGRVQGKIVKAGQGIYQCVESPPAVNPPVSEAANDKG